MKKGRVFPTPRIERITFILFLFILTYSTASNSLFGAGTEKRRSDSTLRFRAENSASFSTLSRSRPKGSGEPLRLRGDPQPLLLSAVEGSSWGFGGLNTVAYSQNSLKIPLYIKSKEIWVEVAKTPEERAHGLMGRKHLGKDDGMLFIFEREDYHEFWMKNTQIPLSIAFVDKEGQIIGITDMKPLTLETHAPPQPVLYALEMRKGWFSANGIKVGDTVKFSK